MFNGLEDITKKLFLKILNRIISKDTAIFIRGYPYPLRSVCNENIFFMQSSFYRKFRLCITKAQGKSHTLFMITQIGRGNKPSAEIFVYL